MLGRPNLGTTIGMTRIKERRMRNELSSHPGLKVGECVPFYFCPRSVMLYVIDRGNLEGLSYSGGQSPIVHLELDMQEVVRWAEGHQLRWAFTLNNAGLRFFDDRVDLAQLDEVNWEAVEARDWRASDIKEAKQSELLVERKVSFDNVVRIGTHNTKVKKEVQMALNSHGREIPVEVITDWYY